MENSSTFSIKTAADFLNEMVLPQYEDFLKNNSSSRHALLCTMTSYHLYEWVNGKKFTTKTNHFQLKYPKHTSLIQSFELARKITNGTKHFCSPIKTRIQPGFSSAFSSGFAKPLVIECDDGSEISADQLLESIIYFWKEQYDLGRFN